MGVGGYIDRGLERGGGRRGGEQGAEREGLGKEEKSGEKRR